METAVGASPRTRRNDMRSSIMKTSSAQDTEKGVISRISRIASVFMGAFLAILAALAVSLAAPVQQADAKMYTSTWQPAPITQGGWVNLSTSISIKVEYNPGDPTMKVSYKENWTSFGYSPWKGDGFKDGFCLITPPAHYVNEISGCNYGSGRTDTHAKARQDFQTWANANGSTLIYYASQSNKVDSNGSSGGTLNDKAWHTYTYDVSGYKPGDRPVLLYYGNRYQNTSGHSFVYHYDTYTTGDLGLDIQIAPKVTSSSGTGGTITPAGTIPYTYKGNSKTYTWARNYGYALKDVKIDGKSQGKITSYQFKNLTADHTISVEWQPLGDIDLTKVTGDSSLSVTGRYALNKAQYILYTDEACTKKATDVEGKNIILTTDANGKAKTQKVIYDGTYYLKETVPSMGYRLDPTAYKIVISGGSTAKVTSQEPPQRGYITVQKKSSAASLTAGNGCYTLAGAIYKVYRDGAEVATLTTDATGKTNTFTAPLGYYTVKEVKPSEGFRLDRTTYSVDIVTDNQSRTFSSTEIPLIDTYPLALHKMDQDAEDQGHADTAQGGLSLEGAVYKVTYYDGYYTSPLQTAPLAHKWEKTFTTAYDAKSKAFFEVLSDEMFSDGAGKMGWPLGTYVVEEIEAPFGYYLDAKDPYIMQVTKATEETAESHVVLGRTDAGDDKHITADNPMRSAEEVMRSDLRIMIFGEDTTDPDGPDVKPGLPGVSFEIINENDYDVFRVDTGTWAKPGEVIGTITSNNDGYCSTNDLARQAGKKFYLPCGEYRVHEVEETVPDGYKHAEDFILDVSIPEHTYSRVIEDKIGTALKIVKKDAETGKTVRGFASFSLLDSDGNKVPMVQDYPSGAATTVFTTNIQGWAVLPDKLMPGTYYIHEEKAPSGYVLPDDIDNDTPFMVTGDSTNTYDEPFTVSFSNKATKGTLRVSVIDAETSSLITGGTSTIKVYASEDIVTPDGTVRATKGEMVYEGTTVPGKGFFDTPELYLGKYHVVQTSAPDGYALNSNTFDTELRYQDDRLTTVKGNVSVPNVSQKAKASLDLFQSDSGLPILVAGGGYDMIAAEDIITPDGTIRYKKGEIVDQIVTDATGNASTTVGHYIGKYVFVQTQAPDGYVIDDTPIPVEIIKGESGTETAVSEKARHENVPQTGAIKMNKLDRATGKNVLVAGCEFVVYAKEDIITGDGVMQCKAGAEAGRMKTTAEGVAVSAPLYLGTYIVKEIKAPTGYMRDEAIEVEVTIAYEGGHKQHSDSGMTGYAFSDKVAEGGADIRKVDAETKLPLRQAGVKIDVIAAEDIVTGDGTVRYNKGDIVASGVTDEDGVARFDGLVVGKYAAVQKSPVGGYDINDTPIPFEVTYKDDTTDPDRKNVEIGDNALTGELVIEKKANDDSKALITSGVAKFTIYADSDIVTTDGTVRFTAGTEIGRADTVDGIARFSGLYSGRYRVVETEAPTGYVADSSEHFFDLGFSLQVGDDGTRNYQVSSTVQIYNTAQKSKIAIENRDKTTGELICGKPANFDIYAAEDVFDSGGNKVMSKGDLIASAATGDDGRAEVGDLPLGKYEIIMTTPSDGYPLDDTRYQLETKYDPAAGADGGTFTKEYLSDMPTGMVDIAKLDGYDKKSAVTGAKFALISREDIVRGDGSVVFSSGETCYTAESGEDGHAVFEGVHQGRYTLSETEAPAGYIVCEDQDVDIFYKHGETEELAAGGGTADGNANDGSAEAGEDAEIYEEVDGENDKTGDLFSCAVTVYDAPMRIMVSKTSDDGTALAGCKLELYRYDEKASMVDESDLIDTWTTIDEAGIEESGQIADGKATPISGGDAAEASAKSAFDGTYRAIYPMTPGKYVLVETEAAQGYEIAEPIVFEVKNGEEKTEVHMIDNKAALADDLIVDTAPNNAPIPFSGVAQEIAQYGDGIIGVVAVAVLAVASALVVRFKRRKSE